LAVWSCGVFTIPGWSLPVSHEGVADFSRGHPVFRSGSLAEQLPLGSDEPSHVSRVSLVFITLAVSGYLDALF